MKTYVSIACLGFDSELTQTIKSCLLNAHNPVTVGVAMIGNKNFYNHVVEEFKDNPYVKIKYLPFTEYIGVSGSRIAAASMFDDEDYFFQVDAHTMFRTGWDSYLAERYHLAQEHTGAEKVILSGYPGDYYYDENSEDIIFHGVLGYPEWSTTEFMIGGDTIPKWTHDRIENISKDLKELVDTTGFAPVSKISAACVFGGKDFGKNQHLPKKILFWEEEIIQTIELINNGFVLVYPGELAPIWHLYSKFIHGEKGYRDNYISFTSRRLIDINEYYKTMKNNFLEYFSSNRKSVEMFEKYCGISIHELPTKNSIYPLKYTNKMI